MEGRIHSLYLGLVSLFILLSIGEAFSSSTQVETLSVDGKELILNGRGIRTKTFLKIKVYEGKLFLLKKSSEVSEVLKSSGPKHIQMSFFRNVGKEKIQNAWKEGFERVYEEDESKLKAVSKQLNELNGLMVDFSEHDIMAVSFYDSYVMVKVKDAPLKKIEGEAFSKGLFSLWFVNAEDEGLMNGLLGKS